MIITLQLLSNHPGDVDHQEHKLLLYKDQWVHTNYCLMRRCGRTSSELQLSSSSLDNSSFSPLIWVALAIKLDKSTSTCRLVVSIALNWPTSHYSNPAKFVIVCLMLYRRTVSHGPTRHNSNSVLIVLELAISITIASIWSDTHHWTSMTPVKPYLVT